MLFTVNGGLNMKAFIATFKKVNGELRTMKYVHVSELPQEFITTKIKNTGKKQPLKESQQLVWDLDKNDFRILNKESIIGEIKEVDFDFEAWYTLRSTN